MALSSVPAPGEHNVQEALMTASRPIDVQMLGTVANDESSVLYTINIQSADELLTKSAQLVCQRHRIAFNQLTGIQRKFVTHFRCDICGLLPLYHVNLTHVKRVRCRKCRQLISFKTHGKYGRIRKAVAFEMAKVINGGARYVP
jgi:hypothetical protein